LITVICPVFNEENYICKLVEFFVEAKPVEKELIVIDGGSTDNTLTIVKECCKKHGNIHLMNNPDQIVPHALNLGIKNTLGDPIIRLDAHTEYESDYFEKVLDTFGKTGSDIVGGPMRAIGKSNFQKAVAITTSTSFGTGNSKIHNENYEGLSDHVYLGAWQRKLFDEIGYFDEQLKRNQDDEFHYRAKSLGKKIYINPAIKCYYFPRNSYAKLIKQYFQYGLFKPFVMFKIKSEVKLRHLIPSIFALYILFLPIVLLNIFYLIPLIFYVLVEFYFVVRLKGIFIIKMHATLIYPILHLSYGIGVVIGLIKRFNVVRQRSISE